MKKINRKGFTLIELLAVITIMGILMLVAIPAVSRTIENTRRDQFLDTAKNYVNSVKTMWTSDSLECPETAGATNKILSSALIASKAGENYYVLIDSSKDIGSDSEYPTLLESGGKSSWGSRDVKGYVVINVKDDASGEGRKVTYDVVLTDNIHGIKPATATTVNAGTWSEDAATHKWSLTGMSDYSTLKRAQVVTSGATYPTMPVSTTHRICTEA